jgi:dienelactone hydrolase
VAASGYAMVELPPTGEVKPVTAGAKNDIRYEGHIYSNSLHRFFNDAPPDRYNKVAAQQAWTRTSAWFNQYVRG